MKRTIEAWLLVLAAAGIGGCVPGETANDESAAEGQALVNLNGLNPNGLNPNGLNPNGLNPNGLAPNGLNPNGLSGNGLNPNGLNPNGLNPNGLNPNGLGSILLSDPNGGGGPGDLSRQLLSKLWSCAFAQGDNSGYYWYDAYGYYTTSYGGSTYGTTDATWVYAPTGAHWEPLTGSMGLAPGWHDRGLTTSEKDWLTACVLARVNRYGRQMTISTRGWNTALIKATNSAEVATFHFPEAAFFSVPGHSLFDTTPVLAVCKMNVDRGLHLDSYNAFRTCGDWGKPDCGIMRFVGDCSPTRTGGLLGGPLYSYKPSPSATYPTDFNPLVLPLRAADSTSTLYGVDQYDAVPYMRPKNYAWTQYAVMVVYDAD